MRAFFREARCLFPATGSFSSWSERLFRQPKNDLIDESSDSTGKKKRSHGQKSFFSRPENGHWSRRESLGGRQEALPREQEPRGIYQGTCRGRTAACAVAVWVRFARSSTGVLRPSARVGKAAASMASPEKEAELASA